MAKSMSEKAAKAVGAVRGFAKGTMTGYTGIFQTLIKEHGEVSALMGRVLASHDAQTQRELFTAIRAELLSHAEAEEQEFYAVLLRRPTTREMAEQSLRDHKTLEDVLIEMAAMDPEEPAWSVRFRALKDIVDQHVQEEEKELFPRAKDALTKEQVQDIDARFQSAKARARARL